MASAGFLPPWRRTGADFHGVLQQDTINHSRGSPMRWGPHSRFTEETGRPILEPDFPGFGFSSHFICKTGLMIMCPRSRTESLQAATQRSPRKCLFSFQISSRRLVEAESLAQGRTARRWPRQDWNPDPGTPLPSLPCLTPLPGRKRSSFAF